MSVREVYQGPGDFRVSMNVSTPHLMEDVTRGGYLVILPQHIGDPRNFTDATLLAAARYTGIVLETIWRDGVLTLEGAGLDWILGGLDGIGWPVPARTYSGASISTVFDEIATGGIIPAALTVGSTVTGAGALTQTWTYGEVTVKEALMVTMAAFDNHYKISPNGEMNTEAITSNNLYLNTPEIVMVPNNWGSDALYTGIPVGSLTAKYSIREWLSGSGVSFTGISGSGIERVDTTTTDTTRQIAGHELQMQDIRTAYSQLGDNAAVGDNIYVYHPGAGFTGTETIRFRGQFLKPMTMRVKEATWPVVDGMGVYYRPGASSVDTDDWIDLTFTTAATAASRATTLLRADYFYDDPCN